MTPFHFGAFGADLSGDEIFRSVVRWCSMIYHDLIPTLGVHSVDMCRWCSFEIWTVPLPYLMICVRICPLQLMSGWVRWVPPTEAQEWQRHPLESPGLEESAKGLRHLPCHLVPSVVENYLCPKSHWDPIGTCDDCYDFFKSKSWNDMKCDQTRSVGECPVWALG